MTLSVGIRISPKYLPRPKDSILRSRVVRTLFSCPEYVLTTYHFFKTKRSRLLRKDQPRQALEHKVPGVDVGREDKHDDQDDSRALAQLVPIRPADPLELALNVAGEPPRTCQEALSLLLSFSGPAAFGGGTALSAHLSTHLTPHDKSRAGGTRTPDLRFWRPLLYQLSYCPLPIWSPGAPYAADTTGNISSTGCGPE